MLRAGSRTLRDVLIMHRQNHAMLVMLARRHDVVLDPEGVARFEAELGEIDERIRQVSREAHAHATAAAGDRADRRAGDRRIGERRI